jgi:hypothetical protein
MIKAGWTCRHAFLSIALLSVFLAAYCGQAYGEKRYCTCTDIRDIENGIKEVEAAIEALDWMIERAKAKDSEAGKTIMFSKDDKEVINGNIKIAMNDVTDNLARKIYGETNGVTCEPKFEGNATECLRQAVQIHERCHAEKCKAYHAKAQKGSSLRDRYIWSEDYYDSLPRLAYLQEEHECYSRHMTFLKEQLSFMNEDCVYVCACSEQTFKSSEECQKNCGISLACPGNTMSCITPMSWENLQKIKGEH